MVFGGEHALHVLCANRRGKVLVDLIKVAAASLSREQLKQLFHTQASGPFFTSPPMSLYGGTVFSYAVAFSLKEAISCMLSLSANEHPDNKMAGIIDPNDHVSGACCLTGLMPIHVAVVNGLQGMYDYLVTLPGLPDCRTPTVDFRSQRSLLSQPGKIKMGVVRDIAHTAHR